MSHLSRCVCVCVSFPDVFYVSLDSDEEVVSRLCWKEHHFSATPTPCFDDDGDDYENNYIRMITTRNLREAIKTQQLKNVFNV